MKRLGCRNEIDLNLFLQFLFMSIISFIIINYQSCINISNKVCDGIRFRKFNRFYR